MTFAIYHGGAALNAINQRCIPRAPRAEHGNCWTSQKMTDYGDEQPPYIVDNGVFTGDFNPTEWTQLLDDVLEMPREPAFVILPDVFNNAKETIRRNKEWVDQVKDRGLTAAAVAQPGLPVREQVEAAVELDVEWLFVGGEVRWKRDNGEELVQLAHAHGLNIHVGNPSGVDGLEWAYNTGFDSADTTTVVASEAYHYLDRLHEAMTTLYLVGCTQRKRDETSKARRLYDKSPIFRKRKRVLPINAEWRILSAEHGLVNPDKELEPYDTHIKNVDVDAWADDVVEDIPDWVEHIVVLASNQYANPLIDRMDVTFETPLSGLRPGEQMQKLNRMNDNTNQTMLNQWH